MMLKAKPVLISLLVFFFHFYSSNSFAISTKELAETEISQSLKGVKMTSPSEVQLSGVIQMQTTDLEKQGRDWKYLLNFSYFNVGLKSNETQGTDYSFQQKEISEQLPLLGFGFLNNSEETQYGLMTELGFSSRSLQANFKSGLVEKDIRLNSTWLALLGLIRKAWGPFNHTAKLGAATQLNSQSSSNSFLSDFESPSSAVAAYELSYNFNSTFSLNAEARLINQLASSKWKLDSNSYGIGATAKW